MIMEAINLSFKYDNTRTIFHDISFCVDKGEMLSILGPNGAGKSTLLNCLANQYKPATGEIRVNGKPMNKLKLTEVAKCVGYVPQLHYPAYAYTVRDFVVMGRTPYIGLLSQPKDDDYIMVHEVLKRLGIEHLAYKPYTEISGGERQKVTIARTLAQEPELVLMDEPTAHLDYGNQWRIIKLIKELSRNEFAIIMTTHMPDHALMLGGRVGIMDNEGYMALGDANEILTEERLSHIYQTDLKMVYVNELRRKTCVVANF